MSGKGPLLLTGASGWFGRTALQMYEQEHGPEALRREVIPFASCQRWVDFNSPYGPVQAYPLGRITQVNNPRGLLHLAFLTRDKVDELGLKQYVARNRAITACVGNLLLLWPRMPVVTSSSGAAAALDDNNLDLHGNPYATLKVEEELLLKREARGRMALVFRIYAASGSLMTRPEKFALGNLLLQTNRNSFIRVHSQFRVERSYVWVANLMTLSWKLLASPKEHGYRCIDACTHRVEIRELARLVAKLAGSESKSSPILDEGTQDIYCGSSEIFRLELARFGISVPSLEDQIRDTALGLGVPLID